MTASINTNRSVSVSANSVPFSAAPFATVRIVPSFGFITALYAVSTAFSIAFAMTSTVIVSYSAITFVKPRNSWDKITPELPLAPRSEPEEIAFDRDFMSGFSNAATSFAADMIVIDIFVPVSPSGTGNTFNSLIHSFFASKFAAPAKNILANTAAFIELISTFKSSLIDHSYAFNVDVDLLNFHSGKFFYFIFYRFN